MTHTIDRRPWLWLVLGAALIAAAHLRFGVGVLALAAPVPLLRYLRLATSWRARAAIVPTLLAAWSLALFKIATAPIPPAGVLLFAIPVALAHGAGYLGADALRRRASPALAPWIFAASMAIAEWALYALTPFGSWGAAGQALLDDLPLLQVASITGIAGVGFLVNLVAGALELALDRGVVSARRELGVALALVAVVHAGGALRLAIADDSTPRTVAVAAVATDSDIGGLPLPPRERTHAWDRALLDRTRAAAAAGAELVVWPEAGTLVWPDEEQAWAAALGALARETGADVVAGYIVPLGEGGTEGYRNEYRLALRDGTLMQPYAKNHPVPGEPARPGTGPVPAIDRPWGRLSGAICYDFDFPSAARDRARAGVDLVALPSSDWRGIDPIHSQMAAVRAIEGGHSILRSTRWGLSVAVDPHGRIRARSSAFEPGPGILHASLPATRVPTLYALWGDAPILACAAFLGAIALAAARARGARRSQPAPA